MRVPSENSLLRTQVIVNALVVLVDVAATAIVLSKVTVRIAYLIRHRHVGQKRLCSGVDSAGRNHVSRKGGPASRRRCAAESPHRSRKRIIYPSGRGLPRWRQTGFG